MPPLISATSVTDFPRGITIDDPERPSAVNVMDMRGLIVMLKSLSDEEVPVARTVKLNVPSSVGVPLIIPVVFSRSSPAGRAPEAISHVIVELAVLAFNFVLYATPIVDSGREVVVI